MSYNNIGLLEDFKLYITFKQIPDIFNRFLLFLFIESLIIFLIIGFIFEMIK